MGVGVFVGAVVSGGLVIRFPEKKKEPPKPEKSYYYEPLPAGLGDPPPPNYEHPQFEPQPHPSVTSEDLLVAEAFEEYQNALERGELSSEKMRFLIADG